MEKLPLSWLVAPPNMYTLSSVGMPLYIAPLRREGGVVPDLISMFFPLLIVRGFVPVLGLGSLVIAVSLIFVFQSHDCERSICSR